MKNSLSSHLLFVEPSRPVRDLNLADSIVAVFHNAVSRETARYRGVHECTSPGCRAVSDNVDHYVLVNDVEYLTNSLASHYLTHHRSEVPAGDMLILRDASGPVQRGARDAAIHPVNLDHVGFWLHNTASGSIWTGPIGGYVYVVQTNAGPIHSGTCADLKTARSRVRCHLDGIHQTVMPPGQLSPSELVAFTRWLERPTVQADVYDALLSAAAANKHGPHTAEWCRASEYGMDFYRRFGAVVLRPRDPEDDMGR